MSINACADQLIWRWRIGSKSAHELCARSGHVVYADRAEGLPIRGDAEKSLKLKPDWCWREASRGARLARSSRPRAFVLSLSPARSIEDVKNISGSGIAGGPRSARGCPRGRDRRRVCDLKPRSSRLLRALQLQRRAFAAGTDTLIHDIMQRLGIVNGDRSRYQIRRPHLARGGSQGETRRSDPRQRRSWCGDQGVALLSHPALEELVPRHRGS